MAEENKRLINLDFFDGHLFERAKDIVRSNKGNLVDEQKKIGTTFLDGLTESLGIPRENFDDDDITNWMLGFLRSFVKEENLKDTITPTKIQMQQFGWEIGNIIKIAIDKIPMDDEVNGIDEPIAQDTTTSENKEIQRKNKPDISIGV